MTTATLKEKVAGTKDVAKRPETFPAMIEQLKKQVALALPRHLNADRMARIALTEFRKSPKLAKCDPTSVFASVIVASQLGLEPGVIGQGYLVPYKDQCQFIPGWQGLLDLAQRTGRIAAIGTGAVYPGDTFAFELGSNSFVRHVPGDHDEDENPKNISYFFSFGRVKGSEVPVVEVWSADKVRRHRDRFNKVGQDHYSFKHWEMYGRKIPLLQVLKYMPKSVELSQAIELANKGETGEQRLDVKEAIEGTFTTVDDTQKAGNGAGEGESGGDYVPHYTDEAAVTALRAATIKSRADLDAVFEVIQRDFANSKRPITLPIEAAFNERSEALAK